MEVQVFRKKQRDLEEGKANMLVMTVWTMIATSGANAHHGAGVRLGTFLAAIKIGSKILRRK